MNLSVIMPVYNVARYIRRTIDSVLTQTLQEFELIIVNDGSTDETGKICGEYAKMDPRVRVIYEPNGGVSKARNLGLRNATGDYIYFMDADDCLYQNTLKKMVSSIREGIDMVMGGYEVFNEHGEKTYSIEDYSKYVISRYDAIVQMYRPQPYRYQGYIWNKLYRLDTIRKNNIRFNESICFNEDRLFNTEYISSQKGDIFVDNAPVYKYYERATGAMASISNQFNPKFVTDFYSMIQMKRIIKNAFISSYLNELAMDGIVNSYRWIHNMMRDFNEFDVKLHRRMKLKLLFALDPKYLLKQMKSLHK